MNITDIRETKIETLNELIAVTRDSAKFYGEAAGEAQNPQLKDLFKSMADAKNGLVGAISREVKSEGGTPEDEGTFRGSLQRMYGNVRGKISGEDYGYVAELEESEDRMLNAFKDVLNDEDAPLQVKTVVRNYLPKVQEHHDLMRSRKWTMKATKH
jgi:uncharacterized protein (TIGR02284 family)